MRYCTPSHVVRQCFVVPWFNKSKRQPFRPIFEMASLIGDLTLQYWYRLTASCPMNNIINNTLIHFSNSRIFDILQPDPTNPYLIVTHKVFLDIAIEGTFAGRLTIGLFGNDVPWATKNFIGLATKTKRGEGYKYSKVHRIIRKFIVQGTNQYVPGYFGILIFCFQSNLC